MLAPLAASCISFGEVLRGHSRCQALAFEAEPKGVITDRSKVAGGTQQDCERGLADSHGLQHLHQLCVAFDGQLLMPGACIQG
jgi:hypothetical protein